MFYRLRWIVLRDRPWTAATIVERVAPDQPASLSINFAVLRRVSVLLAGV